MTAQAGGTTSSLLRQKAQLRTRLRARRAGLPAAARRTAARRAALALARAARRWQVRHVAAYLGFADELDTAPLIEALQGLGCAVYVPVVGARRRMRFALLAPPLRRNRYGILEPFAVRPPPRLDLVVLPLVAYDARGQRLGMGAGFYDRWLARHPRVRRVGYAYAAQRVARVPSGPHDVPLHAVATEHGIEPCTG